MLVRDRLAHARTARLMKTEANGCPKSHGERDYLWMPSDPCAICRDLLRQTRGCVRNKEELKEQLIDLHPTILTGTEVDSLTEEWLLALQGQSYLHITRTARDPDIGLRDATQEWRDSHTRERCVIGILNNIARKSDPYKDFIKQQTSVFQWHRGGCG
ncbi:hypothetical protein Tco_0703275 [Tanacetum coccineum]|uniref:Uncharacterized protein n=1 Tax=Tanacetum coccineum TaxID=301880 RepID=A0ABQ4XYC4_9ASTR